MSTTTAPKAWLRSAALEFMVEEADSKAPLETGGVLVGYLAQTTGEPVVLWASGAGPRAAHFRSNYYPDAEYDEAVIATLYEASGRRFTYLGDWHTHPAPTCDLSWRDRRTLKRIAAHRDARINTPLMILLVLNDQWRPIAWQGSLKRGMWRSRLVTAQLQIHTF